MTEQITITPRTKYFNISNIVKYPTKINLYTIIILTIVYILYAKSIIWTKYTTEYISTIFNKFVVPPEPIDDNEYIPYNNETSVTVTLNNGDTIQKILQREHVPNNDIAQIIKIIKKYHIESKLQINAQIILNFSIEPFEYNDPNLIPEIRVLKQIIIPFDKYRTIKIIRNDNDILIEHNTINKQLLKSTTGKHFLEKLSATIQTDITSALKSLKIPNSNIIELVNTYSHQIDLTRQIKHGDKISVILDKSNNAQNNHKVIYASLVLSGKKYDIYRYRINNNKYNFFVDNVTAQNSSFKAPINISKISSKFGKRIHPVSGLVKMHTGIDIRAKFNTPIKAADNGIITYLGFHRGYGNYIEIKHIKHGTDVRTLYAHVARFAKNLKIGSHVKQGDVIAYVGRTGNACGSHLHYEVKINGLPVDPLSAALSNKYTRQNKDTEKFRKLKNTLQKLSNKLDKNEDISHKEIQSIQKLSNI